jgi:hypothetical protein
MGLAGVLTWHYYKLGDYILYLWDPLDSNRFKAFLVNYYWPIGAVLLLFLFLWMIRRSIFKQALILSCAFLMIPIHVALGLHQIRDYTTAESWLNYGEWGLKETVDYIEKHVPEGSNTLFRKDIDYYLSLQRGLDYRNNGNIRKILQTQNPKELSEYFVSAKLEVIVLDRILLLGATPEIVRIPMAILTHYYELAESFGKFKVYRPKR